MHQRLNVNSVLQYSLKMYVDVTGSGGKNRSWVLETFIPEGVKLERGGRVVRFIFSLYFHHTNDRFENISIFFFAPFQLSSQTFFS